MPGQILPGKPGLKAGMIGQSAALPLKKNWKKFPRSHCGKVAKHQQKSAQTQF
jgi:hypothetical protein